MARRPKTVVLDAWAVLAYLDGAELGNEVARLIADAHDHDIPLMMTMVTAGEVWCVVARKTSEAEADNTLKDLKQLGIKSVDVDWKLARSAAALMLKHKMAYSDCLAAALAKEVKAHLITGDKQFHQVQHEVAIKLL